MKVIIYGPQYGTTRRYAEELGKRTNIEVKNYAEIDNINNYERTGRQYQGRNL